MIYRLHGAIQPYAWGGYDYIARLLGQTPDGQPKAELWFGDHPQAPALIENNGERQPLDQWLARHPEALSAQSRKRFGDRLPFLLKILDVRLPLSIQLHPDKAQAEAGFAREEAANIPAAKRNYPDDNHKPEMMVALSDFWLLHGFADPATISARLAARPSLAPIAQLIAAHGLHEAYARIMRASQAELAAWLHPLLDAPAPAQLSDNPDYWLHHTVRSMAIARDALDPGLLSFYLFNIVCLHEGEGIFQGARLPHAYLLGQNIELMAASNNVLRAGLTPKHIDIPELLAVIDSTPVTPAILPPAPAGSLHHHPAPVDDFILYTAHLPESQTLDWQATEATILLNLEGALRMTDGAQTLTLARGEAAFLLPGSRVHIAAEAAARFALATSRA